MAFLWFVFRFILAPKAPKQILDFICRYCKRACNSLDNCLVLWKMQIHLQVDRVREDETCQDHLKCINFLLMPKRH